MLLVSQRCLNITLQKEDGDGPDGDADVGDADGLPGLN